MFPNRNGKFSRQLSAGVFLRRENLLLTERLEGMRRKPNAFARTGPLEHSNGFPLGLSSWQLSRRDMGTTPGVRTINYAQALVGHFGALLFV
jgi:hypothetical protein